MTQQNKCEICKRNLDSSQLFPIQAIRYSLVNFIQAHHPGIKLNGYICTDDMKLKGLNYNEDLLTKNLGVLEELEKDVLNSLAKNEILAENINQEVEEQLTFGEKLADKVSELGGSWSFIIAFMVALIAWMVINSVALASKAFDPYPYILLNLALSSLAALQAPIIMMSQNRKADRDRIQAESDYKINLKAELEIRHLNSKTDHLAKIIWLNAAESQRGINASNEKK